MRVILVDASGLSMSRPGRPLFDDVSITISSGDRIGLVGLNGTGKSTLIDVLTGAREPEAGVVRRGRDIRIGTLDQRTDLGTGTVADAVAGSHGETWEMDSVLDRLGMGGQLATPVSQLSGGEAKRVALARALVTPSDMLVLDEPTNHLDVASIVWLEDRLAGHKGGLIIVTHDRHVLDRVTTKVAELDRGSLYLHEGGYAGYLEGRAVREQHAAEAEAVRRNLARTELAWLRRGAPARTTKAKARIRSATEIVTARPDDPARASALDLHFGTPRLGNDVMTLSDVSYRHADADVALFEHVDLALDRRERLGIVGANGAGKTTLLDVMAGRREPSTGTMSLGSTVALEYFDQTGTTLDPTQRVWEPVVGDTGAKPDWRDKALMERFWFDSDAQYAPIELLSGGERRRLQLLVTLARSPNVLLLDEPTNDLDLDTLRVLEDFLEDFPGAVIVVSHDRAFLERVVDDVLIVDGAGRVGREPGGYEAYANRAHVSTTPKPVRSASRAPRSRPAATGRSKSTVRHELKATEREIERLEAAKVELTAALSDAGADHGALASVGAELAAVDGHLDVAEERWLELTDELETGGSTLTE